MLHLLTGGNGVGKTLNVLKWVRERQVKEGRPVAYNGRFDPVPDGELKDWRKIDIKDWQDEPDGTIFVVDEAHNDFPVRPSGQAAPNHIAMIAEHRKRGFDFYFITQHPNNLDAFIRRLISAPGWHRHIKRNGGGSLVSILEWTAVNGTCEKQGSAKSADVKMAAFPKEVYGWYNSAVLHTGKRRIPKKLVVMLGCALLAPLLGYYAYSKVMGKYAPKEEAQIAAAPVPTGVQPLVPVQQQQSHQGPMTRDEYIATFRERIPGLPHTAPRYDEVTRPTKAPRPAACIKMGQRCECFTQQGTKLPGVTPDMCGQVVSGGYFVDWEEPQERHDQPQTQQAAQAQPMVSSTIDDSPSPGGMSIDGAVRMAAGVRPSERIGHARNGS